MLPAQCITRHQVRHAQEDRDQPVGEVKGGSSGEAKVQPVCSSLGLSGLVRCHVGCVTDTPIASSSPWTCRIQDSGIMASRAPPFSCHLVICMQPCREDPLGTRQL